MSAIDAIRDVLVEPALKGYAHVRHRDDALAQLNVARDLVRIALERLRGALDAERERERPHLPNSATLSYLSDDRLY